MRVAKSRPRSISEVQIDPPNPFGESLAAAMRQLSENLASYDRRAIARRARERFAGPAIAARLTAAYQRALSDPRAAE